MNREKPEDYITHWKARLAKEKAERRDGKTSIVLFRTGGHWLALRTHLCREIVDPKVIRRIPHRTNDVLLGLVNVRGKLHLCVNLAHLLKLSSVNQAPSRIQQNRHIYRRMVVIEKGTEAWAFQVDEIHSVSRISPSDVVSMTDPEKGSNGIIEWQGKTVDLLDENQLFQKLARSLE